MRGQGTVAKIVSISGQGRVFTDTDNFNKGTFGTIQAGGGLIKGTFQSRETFDSVPKP